ncbi:hypothetical protein [Rhodococcus sp. UFZ-B548]|uniref:hypothetical protein n=1 Tax=Rhodococcus sp. UFZ-B548 TaxID=2742212 RepID=UPI000263BE18|nr:hypothetical protein [Rhodococcus sp. UFZ-B548]
MWSTPDWDWAAGAIDLDLDDEAVRRLQQTLQPGEPVDRQRTVGPPGRGPREVVVEPVHHWLGSHAPGLHRDAGAVTHRVSIVGHESARAAVASG